MPKWWLPNQSANKIIIIVARSPALVFAITAPQGRDEWWPTGGGHHYRSTIKSKRLDSDSLFRWTSDWYKLLRIVYLRWIFRFTHFTITHIGPPPTTTDHGLAHAWTLLLFTGDLFQSSVRINQSLALCCQVQHCTGCSFILSESIYFRSSFGFYGLFLCEWTREQQRYQNKTH